MNRPNGSGQGAIPVLDAGLAVAVAVAITFGTAYLSAGHGPGPIGYGLLAASASALAGRRLAAPAVLAAIVVLAIAYAAISGPNVAFALPLGVALYTITDAGRWQLAVAGIAAISLGSLVAGAVTGRGHAGDMGNSVWIAGWLVASIVLGLETRARRQLLQEAEERARTAGLTFEAETLRRTGEERIRIARELHDILAHRISLINVQASAGLHLMDRQPEQARVALTAIHGASKEALVELRATLGVLRQVDAPDPRGPTPGLSQLGLVVDDARSTGLAVELAIDEQIPDLPAGVDLAAFRIVQESLTNVVRHARAASTKISIAYRSRELLIDVQDNGSGADGRSPGSVGGGLLGMRERAAALGGDVEAGPVAGGGFLVHARLPVDGRP
jgi:signal transduction histidine kinase